ncbi:MAG: S9 family peptidase [bacterium]|nr:S9 family peptidase [bacterium]
MLRQILSSVLLLLIATAVTADADVDPYLWLEEVEGERALNWVERQNERSIKILEQIPEFSEIYENNVKIYTSSNKIPYVSFRGEYVYNFWRDANHSRGLLRRTTLREYRKDNPDWESVLDFDELAAADNENWVYKGLTWLQPECRLAMVALSRGGGDAVVYREFDTGTKKFVEGGFMLPEAKSDVYWKDGDTLYIGTDFGEGSMTNSGYPRSAREWRRGTPLREATLIHEVPVDHVGLSAYTTYTPERTYHLLQTVPEFYRGDYYLITDGDLQRLDLQVDVNLVGFFKKQMLINLRSDWEVGGNTWPSGALLAIDFDDFLKGKRDFEMLFTPSERISFSNLSQTRDQLLVATLDNVCARLWSYRRNWRGKWRRSEVTLPGLGAVSLGSTSMRSDRFFISYKDFLTPTSLYLVEGKGEPEKLKSTPEWFDATGMRVTQEEAVSKDGTRIPYFVVWPKDCVLDGENPTLLSGYGGFENSSLPYYSGTVGTAWLTRGGVYALANIRGGGEFGPRWHQDAVREKQQNSFDDFHAVAEDLIAKGITSSTHLGIEGGSQGGLLVGTAFTQRPELYGAVVCAVPLLDMQRYHLLLAGASWMAEYGDPDKPEDWDFMRHWSPYHLLRKDAKYPEPFLFTSTRDDRVHPAHARKMVAKMIDLGHDVLYWENMEGGHAAAANLNQKAYQWALAYSYLWRQLR